MAQRYNPPPNWPQPPAGWTPPPGWQPDPSRGPAPEGWQVWLDDQAARRGTNKTILKAFGVLVAGLLVLTGLGAIFGGNDDGTDQAGTTSSPRASDTADEAESSTPETSSVPAAPRTPEQALRAAILMEIGDLNREGPKRLSVKAIGEPRTPIQVTFASNENLTEV